MTTALLLALVACGQDAIPTSPSGPEQNALVSVVRVQPSGAVVAPDESVQLSAVVKSARGRTVNGRPVTWSSSDESVAYVDQQGRVVAGREGTATITANVLGVTGKTTVDVRGTVADIEILEPATALLEGDVASLGAVYVYSNGARRPATYVRWESKNPAIVWVDGEGQVTARNAGETEVVVEGRGRRSEMKLQVGHGNITSVTVYATATTLEVGDRAEAWADIRNHKDRRITKSVSWSSSDPSVASISSSGVVTALSVGSTTLTGTVSGVSGSLDIQVVSPSSSGSSGGSSGGSGSGSSEPSNPGSVTDLSVQSSSETSIQLRFTEVDDGTGSAASYQIRYAAASDGFDWNTALDVTKGTCQVPLAGGTVGNVRTCSVDGLVASTEYVFQLVAFRAESDGAIYGQLSNQAAGRTSDPALFVDVVPTSLSLDVGQQKQLSATLQDSYGNEQNASFSWTSSSSAVASVSSSGMVSGQSVGNATIRASASGTSGTSDATVTQSLEESSGGEESGSDDGSSSSGSGSSGSGGSGSSSQVPSGRPNEPGGFNQLVNFDYASAYGQMDDIRCDAPGAPASPDCYGRVTLPQGYVAGYGTGYRHSWGFSEQSELYVAMWVRLRGGPDPSTWEQQSTGTKAFYVSYSDVASATMWSNHTSQQGTFSALPFHVTLVFYNAQGNRQTRKVRDDRTPRFTVNDWHLIEAYYRLNDAGSANGVYRLWLDGNLIISVSDVSYVQPGHSTRGFYNVKPDNIWGGGNETKTRTDYVDLEHIYVSGRP